MPGQNGALVGIRVARPSVAVNQRVDPNLADGLLSLTICEQTTGLYCCEAQFGNWGAKNNTIGFLYFDRATLDFGKPFAIKLGQDTIFDGRIVGLEAIFPEGQQPRLTVLAEDRFQDLRMTRRTRTFTNVSDSDVINKIAGDHGLTARVDLSGPTYKVLAQVNQSDLAFLRERVRAVDAELWMEGRTLHAVARSRRNSGTLKMAYGRTLREFSVLADLAGQRSSVTVSGWDVSAKSALKEQADDSAISNELHGDTSGASVLGSTLGQRKEALVHTVPLDAQTARAEAEAYFRMSARRFIVGHGTADTDSQLRVGSYVDLQDLGPLFSGKYYVSEVTHLFDGAHGIRTHFTAERPGLGRPA
jgi:phage protein D